jgi:transcriptional regulator with XRE-family HTH domain
MNKKSGWKSVDGERLRERREELMLSQRELAVRAKTTQATISAFETGARRGTPRTIRVLAEALGVEPKDLVVRDG